jgi:hypothetical protein
VSQQACAGDAIPIRIGGFAEKAFWWRLAPRQKSTGPDLDTLLAVGAGEPLSLWLPVMVDNRLCEAINVAPGCRLCQQVVSVMAGCREPDRPCQAG